MKITILVKANAKKQAVIKQEDGTYLLSVKSPPIEGRANEEVVELLAKHFNQPKRNVTILKGAHGKHKIVEIA